MRPAVAKALEKTEALVATEVPASTPGNRLTLRLKAFATAAADPRCLDLAAQVSFYLVLSVFPFFIILAAVIGTLPGSGIWHSFVMWVATYIPSNSQRALFTAIFDVSRSHSTFLSFGLLLTLWSASSGIVSLMESLTWAYGAEDTRSFWRKRLIAIGATVVAAIFFISIFGVLTAGHLTAAAILSQLGGHNLYDLRVPFEILRWAASVALVCVGINLISYFLPDVDREWCWYTPGTLLIALTFLLASVGFRFYVAHFANFPKVYGALSSFIILMTWIYLSVAILLIGARANHILDHINARGMRA
jgi:membrane protein